MKRQTQTTGIRYWFGGAMLDLQAEPLKVLDGFFTQYGNFVISGCEVTSAAGGKYNISEGLVALQGNDPEGEPVNIVVPFAGLSETVLPVYLTLGCEVLCETYADGALKPVAYDYKAVSSNVQPQASHLAITSTSVVRFVDVVQDATHRFITDSERSTWNNKESKENVQTKVEASLRSAKEYTDTREAAILSAADSKDSAVLNSSKSYTDTAIAGLAGTVPETLDTLQELAAALGNDPNFATTVLNQIGQKVDKVAGKGLSTNDYTTEDKNQLAALLKKVEVPVGSVEAFAGVKTKIPEGWMLCDGRTLLRADYPELFEVISTTFGYTTSTNFKIPDLRGEFVRGFSDGKSGIDTGRSFGSAQTDALQEFDGYMNDACMSYSQFGGIFQYKTSVYGNGGGAGGDNIYRNSVQINLAAAGVRTADETRPRNIALNYIIKVKSSL